MDAQHMARAVQTLRDALGNQIGGDQQGGLVQMRQTLEERLGISEGEADALVKTLAQTRQILYHPNEAASGDNNAVPGIPLGLPVVGMGTGGMGNPGSTGIGVAAAGMVPNPQGVVGDDTGDDSSGGSGGRGYWEITDPTAVGKGVTTPTSVMGEDYQQTDGDSSYNSDLRAAGQDTDRNS